MTLMSVGILLAPTNGYQPLLRLRHPVWWPAQRLTAVRAFAALHVTAPLRCIHSRNAASGSDPIQTEANRSTRLLPQIVTNRQEQGLGARQLCNCRPRMCWVAAVGGPRFHEFAALLEGIAATV